LAGEEARRAGGGGVKNKLTDLNNHLFAQLERLSDESLTAEQIDLEVKRSEAIVGVAEQIAQGRRPPAEGRHAGRQPRRPLPRAAGHACGAVTE
jgi:hypothetical protein